MVLSTNQRLEMQTGIKDKKQNKPCTLRSISHQREALYLYRVKFRSTSPRLDYSSEGGLISLLDRPHLERQYADETVRTQSNNSRKAKADIFFFILFLLFLFYFFIFIFIWTLLRSNLAYS